MDINIIQEKYPINKAKCGNTKYFSSMIVVNSDFVNSSVLVVCEVESEVVEFQSVVCESSGTAGQDDLWPVPAQDFTLDRKLNLK